MATFGQIVYSILDLLKEHSDDAYYTEEHIIFLASKMRSLLLERKYKATRNGTFNEMSPENKQQICVELEPATMLPGECGGNWLRSVKEVPEISPVSDATTCTGHDMLPTMVTFIPAERMPYVGYNKWLRNFIYVSRSKDGHLYLKGKNPQFMYLEKVGLTAVFSDPDAAAKMSHEACETGVCNILEQEFPLESALVPTCIEMVLQELLGSRYAPEDKKNNAQDDLGKAGVTGVRPRAAYNRQRRAQDAEDE